MSDLLGLRISEGALANMLDASRPAFAWQASLIRQHLLCGTAFLPRQCLPRSSDRNRRPPD
jgi:hypothetical protein